MPEDGGDKPEPVSSYDKERDCIENIVIPPLLPQILKLYTKAAMRTQPNDLLRWTLTYMRAMEKGNTPPVKDRGETEPIESAKSGLTPGFLRVMHAMLKDKNPDHTVSANDVTEAWEDLSFNPNDITDVIERAELSGDETQEWLKVMVVFANTIPSDGDVTQTMRIVCEVLTEQPDGAEPYINYTEWWELYVYLAKVIRNISTETIHKVNNYLEPVTNDNFCLVGPKDFINPNCPALS